jgi:pimeloyl-ACP methyl ester carboxylesterase
MDLRPSTRLVSGTSPTATRTLTTADGVRLAAAYDAPINGGAEPGICFVVAHGFTGSWARSDNRRIATGLQSYGGVVSLDLRGHGRSEGSTTVGDVEVLDLDAALAYARWLGYTCLVTVGFSMGGAVVLRQAAMSEELDRPAAVVAVSAAAFWFYRGTAPMRLLHKTVHSRGGRMFLRRGMGTRVLPVEWVKPYPTSPEEAAAAIAPTPLLLVHGDQDPYFPLEHPHALHRSAQAGAATRQVLDRSQLWIEPGFGHAEAATQLELVDRIGAWATAAVLR